MSTSSAVVQRSASSQLQAKTNQSNTSNQSALKGQLRGMGYAEGAAMLSPSGDAAASGANVQLDPDPRFTAVQAHLKHVTEACEIFGLDSAMVRGQIVKESGGAKKAASNAGAAGLMQVTPDTWSDTVKNFELLAGAYPKLKTNCPDMPSWDSSVSTEPRKNIIVGCATFVLKSLSVGTRTAKVTTTDKSQAFGPQHPQFELISKLAYTAGDGTVAAAMSLAGSTKLETFFSAKYWPEAIKKKLNAAVVRDLRKKHNPAPEEGTDAWNTAYEDMVQDFYGRHRRYLDETADYAKNFEALDKEAAAKAAAAKKAAEEAAVKQAEETGTKESTKTEEPEQKTSSEPEATTETADIEHTLVEGQTLYKLKELYNLKSVSELCKYNGLDPARPVYHTGDVIKIPRSLIKE